jgi:HEPN domain-containing protein
MIPMEEETSLESIEKLVNHWVEGSDRDFNTMNNLYNSKDYSWSLFLGHLVIEKLLKALYIKNKHKHPIPIHDLTRIADRAGLECSVEQLNSLDTITTFNINARYEDDKQYFYLKCTKEFSEYWINQITELRLWIKSLL